MKVAIVHYWWLHARGGEAVVAALSELFPDADLFVQICDETLVREALGPGFRGKVSQSFISRLPGARRHYQRYLPLMPFALEQFDLSAYDLVFSSESGPAKGVLTRPDAVHICYCHSPMRYLWDLHQEYLHSMGPVTRPVFAAIAHWLRVWDLASASRVDRFIANSHFVSDRIRKIYRRDAVVIPPPVEVHRYRADRPRQAFYLCLGQLVAYKRIDLMVTCFNRLGLPLKIVGTGEQLDSLKRMAGPNIEFLGYQPEDVKRDLLETCRALMFPGLEDFGIVPVEAMAAGAPVIAYGRGGVLDSIVDGVTGVHVAEQTETAFCDAIEAFERQPDRFDPAPIARHASQFERTRFLARIREVAEETLASRLAPALPPRRRKAQSMPTESRRPNPVAMKDAMALAPASASGSPALGPTATGDEGTRALASPDGPSPLPA